MGLVLTACGGSDDDAASDASISIDGAVSVDASMSADASPSADAGAVDAGGSDAALADDTLYEIQDDAMPVGTAVTVRGVVVVSVDSYGALQGGVHVQEPAGGAFSGMFVFVDDTTSAGLVVGDLVDIEGGEKAEFALSDDTTGRTLTEIVPPNAGTITITKVGTGTVPAAPSLDPTALLASDAEAEKWESVLVRFDDMRVHQAPAEVTMSDPTLKEMTVTGPYLVSSGLTELADTIAVDDCYVSIAGIIDYFFDFKLMPRSAADLTTGGNSCLPAEEGSTACMDGNDNDLDGVHDCFDASCAQTVPACVLAATVIQIQDGTISEGYFVSLTGVVATGIDEARLHLWIADAAPAGPYNGIFIYRGADADVLPQEYQVGSVINVTGKVFEFGGVLTEVTDVTLAATGALVTPEAVVGLTVADAMTEPYEGVLLTLMDVSLVADVGFGTFSATDGTTTFYIGDDAFGFSATIPTCYSSLTGIIHYNIFDSRYEVLPRSAGDMVETSCN
jgi:hypothetical protein